MKISLMNSFLAATLLSVALVACDGDKPSPTPKPDPTPEVQVKPLKGDITNAMVLDAQSYILSGTVRVKAGASLTIPAGTVIKAEKGFDQYILVEQGGKIYINGTAEKPVVMTANSDKADSGYWVVSSSMATPPSPMVAPIRPRSTPPNPTVAIRPMTIQASSPTSSSIIPEPKTMPILSTMVLPSMP